ncbi:hypothetical protein R5R35_009808 [Gryllus longicercus]|uniref:Uncharacterized protein n=1 Tax=Gryllus longicercus TaxID=2509291 RepID=A0AAN9UYN2_9ORTH
MMHLTGMVTGMRSPLPISQVPVPFMAAGIPGISWPVCPPVGKIPPQYEVSRTLEEKLTFSINKYKFQINKLFHDTYCRHFLELDFY